MKCFKTHFNFIARKKKIEQKESERVETELKEGCEEVNKERQKASDPEKQSGLQCRKDARGIPSEG